MTTPLPQTLADLGLSAFPFPKAPVPDLLFRWRGLDEALARLDFALAATGFALLTGDVGAGKSSALRLFLHRLDAQTHPAVYVADSRLSPRTFYGRVLAHFGVLPPAPPAAPVSSFRRCSPTWPRLRASAPSSSSTRATSSPTRWPTNCAICKTSRTVTPPARSR